MNLEIKKTTKIFKKRIVIKSDKSWLFAKIKSTINIFFIAHAIKKKNERNPNHI